MVHRVEDSNTHGVEVGSVQVDLQALGIPDVKVGEEIKLRIKSMDQGKATLVYESPVEEEEVEEGLPSDEEARGLPVNKLERRLPKAER